jgi:hypothetical protein
MFSVAAVVAGAVALGACGNGGAPLMPGTTAAVDREDRPLRSDIAATAAVDREDRPLRESPTATGSRIYVANQTSNMVTEYPFDANGHVDPVAKIDGMKTELSSPVAISIDASGLTFVLNMASIAAFNHGVRGNVAPKYDIAGAVTGLSEPQGIAVGPNGVSYVTNDGGGGEGYVTVYVSGANGDQAPIRTIYDVTQELFIPAGIAIHGSTLYVADPGDQTIDEFPSTDNGDVSPSNVITNLNDPSGIALDGSGRIYVTDTDTVVVYAADATGGAKPLRTISGPETMLAGAAGLTVTKSVIAVANSSSDAVTLYRQSASGDAKPVREIEGSNTGLSSPAGVGIF